MLKKLDEITYPAVIFSQQDFFSIRFIMYYISHFNQVYYVLYIILYIYYIYIYIIISIILYIHIYTLLLFLLFYFNLNKVKLIFNSTLLKKFFTVVHYICSL